MYKLTFPNGIHIGTGKLSSADMKIHSDTLFSAMCIEALNIGGEEMLNTLAGAAKNNRLRLSDALPYISDTIYFPKPMCRVQGKEQDITLKKEFKKLEYIPYDKTEIYLSGEINPAEINNEFAALGARGLYQKVSLKYDDDNELYSVGTYKFNENCGLYVIVGAADTESEKFIDTIMQALQYSGIGGKRSAGYGRFTYQKCDVPFAEKIDCGSGKYMTISSCMAADSELSDALSGASYKLVKRSGYVQSQTYSDMPMKKRDFYMFSAGSVFENKFDGDIFDVSIKGNHSVYKYAKPMLIGIGGAK
jgi:CRISPR-associated protein Csm4